MLERNANEHQSCLACADRGRLKRTACGLLALFAATLTACAHAPAPVVAPAVQVREIAPATWQLVDQQIGAASARARNAAEAYARVAMEEWQGLVRQRTEDEFIPWYLGYWTQQWISAKVAWYGIQDAEGEVAAEERLVGYLEEQFYEQVLAPVGSLIDPRTVMEETLSDYLLTLEGGIEWLPLEYRIPLAAFNQHLDAIPAIVVRSTPPHQASLYNVLQSPDLAGLAAYRALLGQIDAVNDTPGQAPSSDRMQMVARRAVGKLADSMALRGGAVAASSLLGGPWGMAISAGAAAWGVVEHNRDRPAMEAQLRANLEVAFEVVWQELVEDNETGVMAPVYHLSTQIERAVARPEPGVVAPQKPEPALLF